MQESLPSHLRTPTFPTLNRIESPISIVENFIESKNIAILENMPQSLAESDDPAESEISAISHLIGQMNCNFTNETYSSLLPHALACINTINSAIWVDAISQLNAIVNVSNYGANDLLFALINRIDTYEAEIARANGKTPISCLNKKDDFGRCPFTAAAEQHDYRTTIKMLESGKMQGIEIGNPLIDFIK